MSNATEIPKTNTAVLVFADTFCIVKYSKCIPLTINFHYVSGFLHSEIFRISTNGNLPSNTKVFGWESCILVTINTLVKITLLAQDPNVSFCGMKYEEEEDASRRYYS